jgi:hypothetical protein
MRLRLLACSSIVVLALAHTAHATDVDGPVDCPQTKVDWGDAPEFVLAYPAVPGNFPTCAAPGAVGTQTFACPPISTPPGPTGAITHVQFGGGGLGNYWLGCYMGAAGPFGIDSESDGKTNSPAIGFSACSMIPTDCVEAAFGLTFDQDECYFDGSDAGITTPLTFGTCITTGVPFMTANCGPTRTVFLNIAVDWNADGDWNDNFACATACAFEWAVVNAPIVLPPGCAALVSPPFLTGPFVGPGWLRISLSDAPMPADYPWNGSLGLAGGAAYGGETEDYPVYIEGHVGVAPDTWGRVKSLYR